MDTDFDKLEAPHFGIKDKNLRLEALTHSSYSYENPSEHNNERLEFEGDAYLKAAITTLLREVCPDWNEDRLTQLRSKLERSESLATFAKVIQVDNYLRIGNGCLKATDKMLEDAFEAIIGAIHHEGGQDRVNKLLFPLIRSTCERLAQEPQRTLHSMSNPLFPTYTQPNSPAHTLPNSPAYTNSPTYTPPNLPAHTLPNSPAYTPPNHPTFTNGGQAPLSNNYNDYLFGQPNNILPQQQLAAATPYYAEATRTSHSQLTEPPVRQNKLLSRTEVLRKLVRSNHNAVSALKEWRDQLQLSNADYKFESAGFDHCPSWRAICVIDGVVVGEAIASGKKQDAKSAAAQNAIERILNNSSLRNLWSD